MRPACAVQLGATPSPRMSRPRFGRVFPLCQFAGARGNFVVESVKEPCFAKSCPGPVLREQITGPGTDVTRVPTRASGRGTWGRVRARSAPH